MRFGVEWPGLCVSNTVPGGLWCCRCRTKHEKCRLNQVAGQVHLWAWGLRTNLQVRQGPSVTQVTPPHHPRQHLRVILPSMCVVGATALHSSSVWCWPPVSLINSTGELNMGGLYQIRSTNWPSLEELNTDSNLWLIRSFKNKIWYSGTQCISSGIVIIRKGGREKEKEREKEEGGWKRGEREKKYQEKRKAYCFHFRNSQRLNVSAWVYGTAGDFLLFSLFSVCFK